MVTAREIEGMRRLGVRREFHAIFADEEVSGATGHRVLVRHRITQHRIIRIAHKFRAAALAVHAGGCRGGGGCFRLARGELRERSSDATEQQNKDEQPRPRLHSHCVVISCA